MRIPWCLLIALVPCHASADCLKDCMVSERGITLTQHFEGYMPFVYDDVADKKTIGFGHLLRDGESFPQPLLPDDADKLLRNDLKVAETGVNRLVAVPLRQGQFDALTDFAFNLGVGRLEASTLLRRVNATRHAEVPSQFERYVYAGGKKVKGLALRRKAEADLYAEQEE